MLDKIFVYESEKYGVLFLNGPYTANPDKLLQLYVVWYNNDYDDRVCEISSADYKFKYSRCAVDFYDEYKILQKGDLYASETCNNV